MGQKAAKRNRQSAHKADDEVQANLNLPPDLQSIAASNGHISKTAPGQTSQSSAADQGPEKLSVERDVDYLNIVQEFNATGGTAQVVREFVSNSIDSGCSSIKFSPLPYPAAKAGFAVVDDGQGMSRPSDKVNNVIKFQR